MAFQKGNKLATGRPVGALNRSTEQMKLTLARAANNTLNNIAEDLEKIQRIQAINVNITQKVIDDNNS